MEKYKQELILRASLRKARYSHRTVSWRSSSKIAQHRTTANEVSVRIETNSHLCSDGTQGDCVCSGVQTPGAETPAATRPAATDSATHPFEDITTSRAESSIERASGGRLNARINKRSKPKTGHEWFIELSRSDSEDSREGEEENQSQSLCPWCDLALPHHPSPYLQKLIRYAKKMSSPDPRPSNALGLTSKPEVFTNVCNRHAFEALQVPHARRKGWPSTIDWDLVRRRVSSLKQHLDAIILDIDEDPLNPTILDSLTLDLAADVFDDDVLLPTRPRKGNVFWRQVLKGVHLKGSGNVSTMRGQLASFDKIQPGYYGEIGTKVITQTIMHILPVKKISTRSTFPITPLQFIDNVLVPEASLMLIREDMGQSRRDAIGTMRCSSRYGTGMFPDE